jgi:arylsulfatase A-like enzyme
MLARSRIVYVLLLSAVAGCAAPAPRDDSERPDILLILVDTLRADHLGVYGYERNTSPNLDAWAKRGIVFDQARSTAPWTNPAIASLFAGLYPQSVLPPATHKEAIRLIVPDSHEMLAERLHTAGYRTVALVDHPGLGRGNGFGQGFEIYDHLYQLAGESGWTDTPADFVAETVRDRLESADQRPTFLYLHLVYPHRPYSPPEPHGSYFESPHEGGRGARRAEAIDSYDGEIRYMDTLIGSLERLLRELELEPWILFTSDHGEGFWEHGRGEHGNSFFDELLRIPLIVIAPPDAGQEAGRSDRRVSLLDLLPTVLEIAGIELPDDLDGLSLLADSASAAAPRNLISESPHGRPIDGAAVIRDRTKYIFERTRSAFDILEDPAENNPIATTEQDWQVVERLLLQHRRRNERRRIAPETREPSPQTIERLEALGYVDS